MYQVSDINTGLPKKGEEVGQVADLRGGFGCF